MRPPLMIFAAGLGTRMRPLTDDRPKPLVKVGDRSLLDRALDLGRDAGCAPVVVNTHYLGQQIADHLAGQDIAISYEPQILDTGGGLRQALPLLGEGPLATLNPDVVWAGPNPLTALQATWEGDRMDALLALIPVAQATARKGAGDFGMDGHARLHRKGDFVYAGAQIIRPDLLADIPDAVFSLNVLWDMLIAKGRVFGMVHTGGWCDVGYPEAIPMAKALLDG
ncbi:nucleotidyltransferase family protein [Paracoccus indicus]|uniref:nucleotidyltransferase family protein n=1 Tax=Paracoccus indicus TaxID=2079229 RepID=UPI001478130C|nr:nucleotidyltransferase family protein [Paracoccus indicus]